MKPFTLTIFIFLCIMKVFAQEDDFKSQAMEAFQKEHYNDAVRLMEQALEQKKDDPEVYYYLGFFNHYRAYDSRPLEGYNYDYSEKIFEYLAKAIALDPDYGDAKYFYGAECSANAFNAMQDNDIEKVKGFYRRAYNKGAYPQWLIEFGKNMLSTCDEDAILFTGGNTDFDVCLYLQLHQNYRKDITIIPVGNIDRPWYVRFLKEGMGDDIRKIHIELTDKQIFDIHPFKWDTTAVELKLTTAILEEYNLDPNHVMLWIVEPDLTSDRKHSKNGEEAKNRTYLSPQKAILLHIIENNYNIRPIYFSNLCDPYFYKGLDAFFRNCGLVSELTPVKTKETDFQYDFKKFESLLNPENFETYNTILKTDIPRISLPVFLLYQYAALLLANHYHEKEQPEKKESIREFHKEYLQIGYKEDYERRFFYEIQKDIRK